MIDGAQRDLTPKTLAIACAFVLLTLVGGGLLGGCASSSPQVSGVGFFNSRNVTVGEQVRITLPLTESGRGEWRIAEFDSLMLRPAGRGSFGEQGGRPVQIVPFQARAPGQTQVAFERQTPSGPERRTIRIRIRQPLMQPG